MIILDLDNTLFNTRLLKKDFRDFFVKSGMTEKNFWRTFYGAYNIDPAASGCYSLDKHFSLTDFTNRQKKEIKKKLIKKILKRGRRYLYNDVVPTLNALKLRKEPMILLTKGDCGFQRLKITATGLRKYFKKIYKVNEKEVNFIKKISGHKKFIYLDDSLKQLNKVKKFFPEATAVLMIRNGQRKKNKNFLTIYDLKEFLNICPHLKK